MFQNRPLTPPRGIKQDEYSKELGGQVREPVSSELRSGAYFVKNVLVVHHGEYNNLEVLSFVSRCRHFMWIRRRFDCTVKVVAGLA